MVPHSPVVGERGNQDQTSSGQVGVGSRTQALHHIDIARGS
ncbi:hypothetical protein AB0K57_15795 [Streptomyces halstedii]